MQWRLYLWGFLLEEMRYEVYQIKPIGPKKYEVVASSGVTFYRYEGMEKDIADHVSHFLIFCRQNNLTEYINDGKKGYVPKDMEICVQRSLSSWT